MKKALSLLKYILLAIGLITVILVIVRGDAGVGTMLTWGYVLLGIGVLAAVLFPLFNLAQNPKGAMSNLMGLGVVVVILVIAYALSSGEPIRLATGEMYEDAGSLKLTDTGLYTTYVALVGAVLVAVLGEIRNSFK